MNLPSDSSKKLSTPDLIGSNEIPSPIADTEEEMNEENGPLNDVDDCDHTIKTKSVVWQHFKKIKVDGKDKASVTIVYGDVSRRFADDPGRGFKFKVTNDLNFASLDQESVRKDLAMTVSR
ncbi:hypothetical protein Patl1_06375 [Pistacia atlantica]|uniref:Uncharacterized protein n=1 Tax=Pistacia atlantica TaxID=434234 RepID=A0ACC1BUV2_9ROSI|nr:hypothetical protein Patl1_06375 [Pistacia atlantica]